MQQNTETIFGQLAKMSSFEDKKKMLFDCLSSAEKNIQGTSLEQKQFARDDPVPREYPPKIRRFHGKESIFKRPEAPIGKCLRPRRVPDYQVTLYAICIENSFFLSIHRFFNPNRVKSP